MSTGYQPLHPWTARASECRPIDGLDASSYLLGRSTTTGRDHVIYYGSDAGVMSVKWRTMKVVFRYSESTSGPILKPQWPLVFDLIDDPAEEWDLIEKRLDCAWVLTPVAACWARLRRVQSATHTSIRVKSSPHEGITTCQAGPDIYLVRLVSYLRILCNPEEEPALAFTVSAGHASRPAFRMPAGCRLPYAARQVHALVGPPRGVTMSTIPTPDGQPLPRAQLIAERAFTTLERFLHIEAVSGIVLLSAAAVALSCANSSLAPSYHAVWHTALSVGVGNHQISQPLHFWINDGLMTIFFLVVGMEIRREIHEGALSDLRQAALPMAAAVGGVIAPALIYLSLNADPAQRHGWAIPTATDIAFAVGVLALLGRSIPGNVRVFLLTLAIVDDVIAVLIIAFFYSGGLDYSGFAVAGLGISIVVALQRIGIGSAFAYLVPGAIVWTGMLMTGAHPTLAGVILGLMTPVVSTRTRERPRDAVKRIADELRDCDPHVGKHIDTIKHAVRELRLAQRELLPPVIRVQTALHPWVAYGIMPLFALANAGVTLDGVDLSATGPQLIMIGVAFALVAGKPLGVIGVSWLAVKAGWCRLPPGVTWNGMFLIGLLAGIGFTMSIFIAMLAFADESLLSAAKLGVLLASVVAAVLGLAWGAIYRRSLAGVGASSGQK